MLYNWFKYSKKFEEQENQNFNTKIFKAIFSILQKQNEQLEKNTENLSKKIDKQLVFKAVNNKANCKDVQEGFSNLRNYIQNQVKALNTEYVTYGEIGNIMKEKLFLQNEQHFDTENYYEKLAFKRSQNDLQDMLKGYISQEKLNDILFKKDIDYVKQEELMPLKSDIRKINENLDNNEINQQVKNAELEDEIKELKKYTNKQIDITNERVGLKIDKKDMNFLNAENFYEIRDSINKIQSLDMDQFVNKYYENNQKFINQFKDTKKSLENLKNEFKKELEKNTQAMQSQIIDYQKKVIEYMKDIKKSESEVKSNDGFDIEIQNLQQKMNKLNKKLSQITTQQQHSEQNFDEQIQQISQQFEIKISNINNDIQNLNEQTKTQKQDHFQDQNYNNQINDLKLQFFNRTQSLENQLKQTQLKIKQKQKMNLLKNLEQTQPIRNLEIQDTKYEDIQNQIQIIQKQIEQITIQKKQNERQLGQSENLQLNQIVQQINKKADYTKILSILDQKANVDDVNNLLKEIYDELDKIPQQQITQNDKNGDFHDEILLYWKNKYLSNKKICWTKEIINSDHSNFVLSKNKYEIIIINEGLYKIAFGFFGKLKPKIEMYLNGHIVVNSQKNNMNLSNDSFENTDQLNHNFIRQTYVDYFILPFNARIWFKFEGAGEFEGFLKIVKN